MLKLAGSKFSSVEENINQALRFCFSHKAVSSVIPGILTPKEAEINANAGNFDGLPDEVLDEIITANTKFDFYYKT